MTHRSRSVVLAMMCAAAVTAQFVAGKATRDALFLTSLGFTALPSMLMATSACALLLVAVQSRWAGKVAPSVMVPAAFVVSGLLFLLEWCGRTIAPSSTAVIVYLHISGAGPLLASGFWLIASERFDPRTAKKGFGRIAGAGTLGGLLGAVIAERVATRLGVPTMLLVLSAFQFLTAWLIRRLAGSSDTGGTEHAVAKPAEPPVRARRGFRVVAETPPLRQLATLVLLGTTGAALVEYLFKASAVEALGPGDHLLRFFALYYAGTSVVTFVLQAFASRTVMERFGLALATSTPSIALLAGAVLSLIAPGFSGLVSARAGETIFRGSWFRAGYELFYTPMPVADKRAAKSVIDVGFDRLGDAVGGGLVRLVVVFIPAAQSQTILVLAIATSVAAILVASTLNRWYLRTLETSLLDRSGDVPPSNTRHDSIRTMLLSKSCDAASDREAAPMDPEMQHILWLRSNDDERIVGVLANARLSAALVPHVIPLLARDEVANYALFALRRVADERVGELVDALLDRQQDP